MDAKPWYASLTIWGAGVAVAGMILAAFGVQISQAEQTAAADSLARSVGAMMELAGLVATVYGRVRASKKIG